MKSDNISSSRMTPENRCWGGGGLINSERQKRRRPLPFTQILSFSVCKKDKDHMSTFLLWLSEYSLDQCIPHHWPLVGFSQESVLLVKFSEDNFLDFFLRYLNIFRITRTNLRSGLVQSLHKIYFFNFNLLHPGVDCYLIPISNCFASKQISSYVCRVIYI